MSGHPDHIVCYVSINPLDLGALVIFPIISITIFNTSASIANRHLKPFSQLEVSCRERQIIIQGGQKKFSM